MEKSTLAGIAVGSVAVAVAALVYAALKAPPGHVHPMQPPDDPPVTVSDGSLHAHAGLTPPWLADATPTDYPSGQTLTPNSRTGTLSNKACTDMVVSTAYSKVQMRPIFGLMMTWSTTSHQLRARC